MNNFTDESERGTDVRVVEDTDKVVYLKLAAPSALTDADLDKVVGGEGSNAILIALAGALFIGLVKWG